MARSPTTAMRGLRMLASAAVALPLIGCQPDGPIAPATSAVEASAVSFSASPLLRSTAVTALGDVLTRVVPSLQSRLRTEALHEALAAADRALAQHDAPAFDVATRRAERALVQLTADDAQGIDGADLDVVRNAIDDARDLLNVTPISNASTR